MSRELESICELIECTYPVPVNEDMDKVRTSREVAHRLNLLIHEVYKGGKPPKLSNHDLICLLVEVRELHEIRGGLRDA